MNYPKEIYLESPSTHCTLRASDKGNGLEIETKGIGVPITIVQNGVTIAQFSAAGTLTATLAGSVSGNVTGNVTGDVTGNVTGYVIFPSADPKVTGAWWNNAGTLAISSGP